MTDLSDINMDGVKAQGEPQGLPQGSYLIRIEDTEKKGTKDRFDEQGNPHPDNGRNFYLQIAQKVYGGPNDQHVEFARLNLWNSNATAVNMAKSTLKAIQEATGVISSNSEALHGCWLILEVRPGIRDASKLHHSYLPAPQAMVATWAHIPPVPAKTVQGQQTQGYAPQPQQQTNYAPQPQYNQPVQQPQQPNTGYAPQQPQPQPAQAQNPNATPGWAR